MENKVTVSIADYATANGWQNEAKYLSIIADKNITITAATPNNGAYTGKYYTNGNNWRIYQTDGGSITITAADGKTIVSVKITYKAEKNGTLLQGNTPVKSGDVVTVNGSSITLSVGNTGTATNGQARITAIEIIYLGEAEAPSCQHTPADAVIENNVAPDCEKEGSYDNVVYCTACGEEISRETVTVKANGHTDGETVVENNVAPDCENEGSYDNVVYCTVCNKEVSRETVTVKANGHTDGETVVENNVAPDCENEGSYDNVVYCTVCNKEVSRETVTVKANGHTDGETVVENNVVPDCEKEGSYDNVVYCTVCNKEVSRETVTVKANGHTSGEAVVENNVAPDCEKEGSYDNVVYCTVCNKEVSRETVTVKANGHTAGAAATCTTAQTCTVCGKTIVAALNHKDENKDNICDRENCKVILCGEGNHIEDEGTVTKDATCEEKGEKTYKCTACGDTLRTEEIPETGHAATKAYTVIDGVLYYAAICGCEDQREAVKEGTIVEITNEADLKTVLTAGYNVVLTANIELTSAIEIEGKEVVINLGGYTITADWVDEDGVVEVLWAKGTGTVVTINGEGSMKSGTGSGTNSVVSSTDGAIVNINGGYYYSASYGAVIFTTRNGVVNIYGGKFEAAEQFEGKWYVLDIDERVDPEYFGEINVYGGEFVNYDPVNNTNDSAALANKVADGYHSIKNDNSYVVSKHTPGDEVRENVNDATCSAEGSYESVIYCSACHAELSRETKTLEKADHTPAEAVKENEIPATCTTAGSYDSVVYCSECNYEISRTAQTIEKRPHSEVAHDAQAATCVAAGCEAYVTCENCDYTTYKEIPATGKHTYSYGKCSVCQADFVFVPTTDEITFELGANGSASHNDGSEKTTYTETVDGYTLSLTNGTKFYTGARDLTGNSCIKLGTSSVTGGFSFTVPDDVTSVVIYVAKYKANTTKIQVNGTSYTINGASDNGVYDEIIVDTTATKTVTLTTVSGGVRAMVNTIMFIVETKHVCTSDGLADCTNAARCLVCGEDVGTANGHTNAAAVTENEVGATCSAEGSYDLVVKCSVCGDEISRETKTIDKLPHTESDWIVDVQATETTEGSQHKKCTVCHEVLDTEVIPTLSHECEYTKKVTDPTCTERGYTTYTCECGASYVDNYVDALDHDIVIDEAVAPTCKDTGLTEGSHCSRCVDKTVAQETVPAIGHNFVDDECDRDGCHANLRSKEVTFEFGANGSASHSDGGNAVTTYSEENNGYTLTLSCSTVYPNARDAKGNSCLKLGTGSAAGSFSFTVPDDVTKVIIYVAQYKANTTKITVNGTSYTIDTASNNGEYTAIEVDTTSQKEVTLTTVSGGYRAMINTIVFRSVEEYDCDHQYNEVTKDATCTVNGSITNTCAKCGKVKIEVIPATGHNHEAVVIAPTCVEQGYTTHTCTNCGDTYKDTYTDPTGVHSYDENGKCSCGALNHVHTPGADATCTEPQTCTECGAELNPALGHTEEKDSAVAPDCINKGLTEGSHCSVCGAVLVAQKEVAATGTHTYDANGNCTGVGCDATKPSSVTANQTIYANKGTLANKVITWTGDNFTVSNAQASSSTAIRTSDSDHFRVYANSQLTITATNGTLTKVVITCTSGSYATAMKTSATNAGYTATVSGSVVTITVNNEQSITFTASAQTRLNEVEVTYTPA